MLEVVHGLDMQVPTIIFGDFNGSADPPADFLGATARRRAVCPLLAGLLGPGGPFIDVHRSLLGDSVPWTFRSLDQAGNLSASRIDLALVNHAALPLIQSASVLTSVGDGGHSPVLLEFRLSGPVTLDWFPPRPRLPPLLHMGSAELRCNLDWVQLVATWQLSPQYCYWPPIYPIPPVPFPP